MKKNKSLLWFLGLFVIVMVAFYSTEDSDSVVFLKERPISFSTPSDFAIESVFEPEGVAGFASEIFEYKSIKSCIDDIETTGYTKETFGVDDPQVHITEVLLDDGYTITYIEPKFNAVNIRLPVNNDALIAVIVKDISGEQMIIRDDDEAFEYYRQSLLKDKKVIKKARLTNFDVMFNKVITIDYFEAYTPQNLDFVKEVTLYHHEKKQYMLMLSKINDDMTVFFVDDDMDKNIDYVYEVGKDYISVNDKKMMDETDQLIYQYILKMKDLERQYFGTKALVIKRIEDE